MVEVHERRPSKKKKRRDRSLSISSETFEKLDQGLFFGIEAGLDELNGARPSGPKFVDSDPGCVRIEYDRMNVRRTADGRSVAEMFGSVFYGPDDVFLNGGIAFGRADLSEFDGGEQ